MCIGISARNNLLFKYCMKFHTNVIIMNFRDWEIYLEISFEKNAFNEKLLHYFLPDNAIIHAML